MSRPRFSIVVCNHNYEEFVAAAVESCLAQDYPAGAYEVIVVDDGSTDGSRVLLSRYAGRPGVTVIEQANGGHAAAFAAGVARARGEYVCLLDSDDTLLPGKLVALARRIDACGAHPDEFFLCHDLDLVEHPGGRVLEESWFDVTGLKGWGESAHLSQITHFYPFAVPCGQVYGRGLLERVLEALPLSDWRRGAESAIAHAALLHCSRVHYMMERLAGYRLHSRNHFASVVEGRFQPRPVWRQRWPKLLLLLEALVDAGDFDRAERNERLAYLGRLEQTVRSSSARRRGPEPLVSCIVDARHDPGAARDTVASIRDQTHPRREIIWVGDPATIPEGRDGEGVVLAGGDASNELAAMRAGHAACSGDYFVFLEGGDRLDPTCMERHLYAHRYAGAMPQVTSCDFRLLARDGGLAHAGVMVGAGRWKAGIQHIPSFAGGLREWPLAPPSTTFYRRTPLLDAFFGASDAGEEVGMEEMGLWLLAHYALCLGGGVRIGEALVDYRLPAAASASHHWLLGPCSKRGPHAPPDFGRAALALLAAYCRARREVRAYLPGAWEQAFGRWLAQSGGATVRAELQARANAAGLAHFTLAA